MSSPFTLATSPRIVSRAQVVIAVLLALGHAAPAASFIAHHGAVDPLLTGWVPGGSGVNVVSGPVAADPAYPGVAAWSIDDQSSASGSASYWAAPPSEIPDPGEPWHLQARLRVVDVADAVDMGTFLEVNDSANRRLLLTFGSSAAGQTVIHVSVGGELSGAANTWTIPRIVSTTTNTEYLRIDLVHDGTAAELHVDDRPIVSGLTGYFAGTVAPRVLWGAGGSASTGHGHYADIAFERSPVFECSNGLDDDGDGLIDAAGNDPDCSTPLDPRERPPVVPCDDGVDTDSDGVCDVDESRLGTSATSTDSDGDGLGDGDELTLYGTNPAIADTDGDGFADGVELAAGRDPNDPTSGPPPDPAWDWAMASRFVDRDPTSTPSLGDRYFVGDVNPTSWRVDFDACATGGLVFEYRWFVDDVFVASRSACSGFQYSFPGEGTHRVRLVAVGTAGEQFELTRTVTVDDLLIFGLGDSYASGEGNPDRPVTNAMVDAYSDALDAVAQTQSDVDAAYAAWQTALADFNALVANANDALSKLQAWQDAVDARNATCPLPANECLLAQAAATAAFADLTASLLVLGISNPGDTYDAIYTAIMSVYNAGLATYTAAVSTLNAAQSSLAAAQQLVVTRHDALVANWQDEDCHRSAFSGQVLAAKRLEQSDPHTSVTFVHLACSGSQIRTGGHPLIGDDGDPNAAGNTGHQVSAMRLLAGGRAVDALFLSIGGNDIGFSSLIESCMKTEPCFQPGWVVDTAAQAALDGLCATTGWFLDSCSLDYAPPPPGENASTMLDDALPGLAPRYASLHHWLEGEYPKTATGELNTLGRIVAPDRVYLTQYPDFAHGDGGTTCGWLPGDPLGAPVESLPGVSQPEHQWASTIAAPALDQEMRSAAAAHGWNFVEGISDAFATNGYCATDHWIVRLGESLVVQGDQSGAAHPNASGHLVYADALEAAAVPEPSMTAGLAAGLMAAGALSRRARTRPRAAGHGDRSAGARRSTDLTPLPARHDPRM